ncbi:MAG: hypothetical protein K2L63_07965, partial [Paramuribaculum sp.]|nr:hypothetical protein [Paramuribaculum sp.]
AKLRDFIASKVPEAAAAQYNQAVASVRAENISGDDGMVMKRDELNATETETNRINGIIVAAIVVVVIIGLAALIRRRRKHHD